MVLTVDLSTSIKLDYGMAVFLKLLELVNYYSDSTWLKYTKFWFQKKRWFTVAKAG